MIIDFFKKDIHKEKGCSSTVKCWF